MGPNLYTVKHRLKVIKNACGYLGSAFLKIFFWLLIQSFCFSIYFFFSYYSCNIASLWERNLTYRNQILSVSHFPYLWNIVLAFSLAFPLVAKWLLQF